MLIEKAMSFESTSYKGLFHFIRYIEQLQKYNVDYGEANLADEQADTVRLMSIHKSKGLEFPIVIVAGMSKRFNMQDTRGSIIVHPEFGVGIDAVDTGRRVRTPTFLKKIMQRNVHLESMGEELRVLYVALTRAKEKLILIGTVSKFDKKLAGFASLGNREETALPFGMLAKASTYFDWIIPALFRNQAFAGLLEKYGISAPFANPLYRREVPVIVRELGVEEIVAGQMAEELEGFLTSELLEALDTEAVYDEGMKAQLEAQFGYRYPYQALQKMKLKFTVSELKKRKEEADTESEALYGEEGNAEEPDIVPLIPRFMQGKEELGGASRGTAYHKVLELLDFGRAYTDGALARALEAFREKGSIGEDAVRAVYRKDILRLLESPLGRRLLAASQAGVLKKEQPFVLGVDAGQLYPEAPGEQLLVQGIIDAYFEEDGELVVVDYKTDRVRGAQELLARYAGQLDYYAQALERVTGKRVKEKIIYSFSLGEEIRVKVETS